MWPSAQKTSFLPKRFSSEWMKLCERGMEEYRLQYINGGQKQRVAI